MSLPKLFQVYRCLPNAVLVPQLFQVFEEVLYVVASPNLVNTSINSLLGGVFQRFSPYPFFSWFLLGTFKNDYFSANGFLHVHIGHLLGCSND